jgi:hypothetical protein
MTELLLKQFPKGVLRSAKGEENSNSSRSRSSSSPILRARDESATEKNKKEKRLFWGKGVFDRSLACSYRCTVKKKTTETRTNETERNGTEEKTGFGSPNRNGKK